MVASQSTFQRVLFFHRLGLKPTKDLGNRIFCLRKWGVFISKPSNYENPSAQLGHFSFRLEQEHMWLSMVRCFESYNDQNASDALDALKPWSFDHFFGSKSFWGTDQVYYALSVAVFIFFGCGSLTYSLHRFWNLYLMGIERLLIWYQKFRWKHHFTIIFWFWSNQRSQFLGTHEWTPKMG